jgi:nucleoside-diphosphate-sugar epimerase
MRILLAGLGDLGSEVARLAAGDGHEVFGLRRSGGAALQGVTMLRGDVTDPSTLALPPALDVTVHCVAADARSEDAYQQAYPRGLDHVLGALTRESPRARVLFVSSTGVYGDAGGAWVDEDTAPAPEGFTGRAMLEAEALLESSAFRGTSLRLGGIYGPRRTFLLDAIRSGRAFPAATMGHWTNRIHRDDAARAILHVATAPGPPPVLNVVDPGPAPRREVLEWLATRLDRALVTAAAAPTRSPTADRRVSSRRLASTGFEFHFPSFKDGYRPLLGEAPPGLEGS